MLPGLADPLIITSFAVPFCNIATPLRSRKDGLSPSHKVFGHPVQDTLPAHHRSFLPEWQRPIATAEQQRQDTLQSSDLLLSITLMLTHCLTSMLDHMLLYRTHKPRSGTYMALLLRSAHNDATTSRPREEEC